jgi:hypothetical protein
MAPAWLASPHLIDAILALTFLEGAALVLWHRRTGSGLPGRRSVRMLLPGFCLLLALRAALAGHPLPWVPAALAAALVCHLVDLRARWRG